MKILWLNWRDIKNPQAGGAEVMTHETAKRLVRAGHEVTIFTARFPKSKRFEVIEGVKTIRAGNRLTCRFFAYLAYQKQFRGNIDLVIDEINTIPFFTSLYVKEKKVALIHQLAREYWWSETFFPLNLLGFLLEPFYLKPYRHLTAIAASKSTKEDLEKLGFTNIHVFYQGLSVKPPNHLPQKSKSLDILFIGRLTKPKGPQDAIVAFSKIVKKFPSANLTVVGKGKKKFVNDLRNKISQLSLGNNVSLEGFASQERKIELLKKAKIILVPSAREGWNLVPIEANAFGCIPIGYNVPGLRDSIKDGLTGILTPKNNPQALAKATITLANSSAKMHRIQTQGLTWAKKFDWNKTYQSVLAVLKNIPTRILWLSWRDIKNPDAGGAEKVAMETAARLTKNGIKVTMFTSRFKNSAGLENYKGVSIIRSGSLLTCRLLAFIYYIKKSNFDIIIDEINTIPFFSIFYARQKTISLIHQLAREYWQTQTVWPISSLGAGLEPLMLALYRKIPTLTVSDSTKKDLENLGFKNIRVIREGLDIKSQLPKTKGDLILFIGRLTAAKGPQDAIVAFGDISKAYPQTKLVIVGHGDQKFTNFLREQTKSLKLENKVVFRGYVSQAEKIRLLKKARIVLIPSVREGWNLVATEANALGAVPVAYNVPGLRDSIRDGQTGLLTDAAPQALAQAALKVLKNENLRQKLAQNGYQFAKKFSWDNTFADFNEVLADKLPKASH